MIRSAPLAVATCVGSMAIAALVFLAIAPEPKRCRPPRARALDLPLALTPAFDGRQFERPVQLLEDPGEPGAWLVVLHRGVVQRVRGDEVTTILDISDRVELGSQWGLQQIALHPSYPADPRLFAAYFAPGMTSKLSVFRARDGGGSFDPASEVVMLAEAQRSPWHCIAGAAFGPDRMLYIGWGGGDFATADPKALRTKMLRIDVDGRDDGKTYAVPRDNPFLGTEVVPEAYAVGLRNPWRFTFDRETGVLWTGDTGENGYEEIDRIVAGGDYGWPYWEGTACRSPGNCTGGTVAPVFAHANSDICAVVGGYVYRGATFPWLRGKYVYADPCSGRIFALDTTAEGAAGELVARTDLPIGSFTEDAAGELYAVACDGRASEDPSAPAMFGVYRLAAATPTPSGDDTAALAHAATGAETLAETGCIGPDGPASAAPGLVAYSIAIQPFADGAETFRFMSEQRFSERVGVEESLAPVRGSLLLKTFAVEGRPVETQMLVRRKDGRWDGYDYRWNADGTDAFPLDRGETVELADETTWSFPGPDQCFRCHDTRAGMLLGLTVSQLNHPVDGRDQIRRFEKLGMLTWVWREEPLPSMPHLDDASAALDDRARAYLGVNCAHCHQPGASAGTSGLDLRRRTPFELTGLCGARPRATLPGHEDALVLAPGAPGRSLVAVRMHATGLEAMPPGRRTVDLAGARLIDEWIRSLRDCPAG